MASEVQERIEQRLEQRFALWDRDGDGDIDRSDFEAEGRRIVQSLGELENSPRGRAVINGYLEMWNALAKLGGVDSGGSLTAEQVSAVGKQIFDKGVAGFAEVARPTVRAIIDLCDKDGDEQISFEEFGSWMDAIGVDRSSAEETFSKIDTNGSGYLSVEELLNATRDFHLGELDVPLLGR